MHGWSMISDRDLYVAEMHNSPKDIDVEAMCSPNDMRNSNNIPNIYDKIRHEVVNLQPRDTDNMLLIHRKRKVNFEEAMPILLYIYIVFNIYSILHLSLNYSFCDE